MQTAIYCRVSTEEERKEMEDLLSEFRDGDDLTNEYTNIKIK